MSALFPTPSVFLAVDEALEFQELGKSCLLVSYAPEAYDSLPSLREAACIFKNMETEKILLGPIRQIFLEFGMHERYGISLLHKHFSMEANQRLVDYRNVSAPWTVNDKDFVVPKYEGFIVPRTFRFFDGNLAPFEFEFSLSFQKNYDIEFFERLSRLLHDHNLENVLGVRYLDTFDPTLSVEVTEGKTNLMIPRGSVQESELIEAFWVFGTDDDQRCHCREFCWRDSDGKHLVDHRCS